MKLDKFKTNVFSQYGEDGVVAKIMEVAGIKDGWCLDIGAWDGVHLSNIRNLFLKGFSCVFVECDPGRHAKLIDNYFDVKRAYCVNQLVFPNRLNMLIGRYNKIIGKPKAVFNIDIDGEHDKYLEKIEWDWPVIIAEWNDRGNTSQYEPLMALAEKNNYKMVCKTNSNLIFTTAEIAEKIERSL